MACAAPKSLKRKRPGIRGSIILAALLIAIPSFMLSVCVASPAQYGSEALRLVAGAGIADVTASVPQNPYNDLAEQLALREAALAARETAARAPSNDLLSIINGYLGFASFFLSIIVFILLSVNFYLDAKRGIPIPLRIPERFKVDLRKTGS